MSKEDDNKERPIPPQIRVAFGVLYHARMATDQCDSSISPRELTPLEKSVRTTALRAIQHYLLGEMDFAAVESTAPLAEPVPKEADSDDSAAAATPDEEP
jgi:hypothetical protein